MKIFFDGGCRPNPGAMDSAVFAGGQAYVRIDIGHGTNSDAEWLALLHGLEVAALLGETDPVLLGDSTLVVQQANGAKCRGDALQAHHAQFVERVAGFDRVRVRYIKRTQNLAGIALEKARL